ncbi:MAG: hypothetical protein E7618_07565 [Ruminococcaceae bacterium]|nr:hypothetical protein [Oscillospiraceae bacterium]
MRETRISRRRGAAPASPARGIFKKIPLHPKNFEDSKKLRFLQGDPEKSLPKTQFSVFCFFAPFFQRKERGSKGQRPLGETRPQYARALPLPPRRGGFLKKSPCTPKTLRIAKNCVFCREILRNPCRKRSFRLYRFFAPFFQRKEQGSKGRRPLGKAHPNKEKRPSFLFDGVHENIRSKKTDFMKKFLSFFAIVLAIWKKIC